MICFIQPVDQSIKVLSEHIGTRWKALARGLNFTQTMIDTVEVNNPRDLQEQIHDFFHRWKQREGRGATVEKLTEGLRAAKLEDCLGWIEASSPVPEGTNILPTLMFILLAIYLYSHRYLALLPGFPPFYRGKPWNETNASSPGT